MATMKVVHVYARVRGDIVQYAGKAYYFQPNGSTCYLYNHKEDIGKTELAVHTVARWKVDPGEEEEEEVAEAGDFKVEEEEEEEAAPALVLAAEIAKLGPKQLQLVEDLVVMLRNMNLATGADRVYQ